MLNALFTDMKKLLKSRIYVWLLVLTAVFSYGFLIVHSGIGIDDTAVQRYYADGLEPVMGRWTLYLINKVFHISYFAPFVTDLVGVMILGISVTLWCALFYGILKDKVPFMGYCLFSCVFISAPILGEIYTYYLHNGISIAYGMLALGVGLYLHGMKKESSKPRIAFLGSFLCLTVAVGCYESMLIVYIVGVIMVYLLLHITDQWKAYHNSIFRWGISGILIAGLTLALRGIIIKAIILVFGLQDQIGVLASRSMSEMLQWFDGSRSVSDFAMVLKRFFLMYYVNGICYFPVTVFVIAVIVLSLLGLYYTVRHRNLWIIICVMGIVLFPWVMLIIEGYPTHYRASQYVPLVCAFAVLLTSYVIGCGTWRGIGKVVPIIGAAVGLILTYNQASEMNKWFYVDYLKYEDAKSTMNAIALELEAHYDTSKPVIIRGSYEVPHGIIKDAYVNDETWQYQWIKKILDAIDPHLMEKYYSASGYGYYFSETPLISVIDWGVNAFDDTNVEFFKFWEMHGHSFVMETDLEKYEEAQQKMTELQMPSWPEEGYIVELEEYIIVNLG